MKKLTTLMLALALLLAACGGSSSSAAPAASVSSAPQSAAQQPPQSSLPAPEPAAEPASDYSWQLDTPENHNMDGEVLAAMHAALPGSGIHSVVTVKDGVIIDEYYEDGYDEQSLFVVHSASKSVTGALIGIAIDEGYIGGADDLLSQYLPQVAAFTDGKQNLTLRHLLTQTSGLEWYEWGGGYSNWGDFRSAENWVDYILSRQLIHTPGTVFNYSTGNTHLLSAVLQAATGMTQEEFCRTRLFDPIGVSDAAHWGTDAQGIADGGNGLLISARDAARFGQLFLQNGSWDGKQIISADWVAESTAVQNAGPGGSTGRYGYQWWIQTHTTGEYGTHATPYASQTYGVYFALGHAGQFIYVVPDLQLVTVFTSSCESSYGPRPYFTDYVLNAHKG